MVSLNPQFKAGADPMEKLQYIEQQMSAHVGHYALIREKSGRSIISYFVLLVTPQQGVYWCFDNTGKRRCTLTKWISYIDILTNSLSIVFLER